MWYKGLGYERPEMTPYKTGSNPSLSARQTKEPQRKLGLFRLCGEKMAENPNGSTGASTAGAGTSERSDDDPRLVQPRARRSAPSNPSLPDNERPWRKLGFFFFSLRNCRADLQRRLFSELPSALCGHRQRGMPAIFSPHFLSPAKVISAIAEGFCLPQKRERAGEAHAAHDSLFESARPCPESWQSGGLKQRAFIGRFGARTTPRKT